MTVLKNEKTNKKQQITNCCAIMIKSERETNSQTTKAGNFVYRFFQEPADFKTSLHSLDSWILGTKKYMRYGDQPTTFKK